jgi:fluoride ion exporter CrcB/FEX
MSKSDIESNVNNKTNTSIISNSNNNNNSSDSNNSNNGNNRVHFLDSEHLDITADVIQLSNDPPTGNITPVFSQESDSVLGGPTEFSFIHTLNLIIFNSFLGTAIRLGLNALFKYKDQQVFEVIYAQLFGSFLFGFLQSTQQTVLRNNLNLFLGFGTGLCGCITTFSSFSLSVFTNLFHINAKSGILQGVKFYNIIYIV